VTLSIKVKGKEEEKGARIVDEGRKERQKAARNSTVYGQGGSSPTPARREKIRGGKREFRERGR